MHLQELTQFWLQINVCFQNAWVDGASDSRNLASQEFIINVENVADSPPIFLSAPPVTRVPENSKIGDFVANIVAVDGDKGLGRPIRYILDTKWEQHEPTTNPGTPINLIVWLAQLLVPVIRFLWGQGYKKM